MINYTTDLKKLEQLNLDGFFVGWPNPPSAAVLKKILTGSYKVVIAFEDEKLIGFISAISDGVLSAYIPFLEVLPSFQGRGVGCQLVYMMNDELKNLYMIDLLCDEELIPYYEKQGMKRAQGAFLRNYENQSGNV